MELHLMGSHRVTCHPTQANSEHSSPLPQHDRLGWLDLPTAEGQKAELTLVVGYI